MTATPALPQRRTLLKAVTDRDRSWDGLFVFAVTSTGIVCRPGCPSRRAKAENIEFFATVTAARSAGYRSCRRCRPGEEIPDPKWWSAAMAKIARSPNGRLSDTDLKAAGFDPVRLRRYSKRKHGMTFHALCRSRQIADAQRRLRGGDTVDRVIVESGYDSHSGFRDAFARVTGRSPGVSRQAEPISHLSIDSPLGPIVIAAVGAGVCLLEFGDRERIEDQVVRLAKRFGGPLVNESHPLLLQLESELAEYWAGTRKDFSVKLAIRGSPFEEATWRALQQIPCGETRSYADIAVAIGNPGAVRAVGSANGRNRLAILIPCHRVVNANGELGGYGGGLWRKRRLLELEAGQMVA